jgi:hypothetical protein
MKWCENQLIKMRTKATIIAESGLKTSQVIDAIKTFIIPMAEFLLRHSNVSLIKLGSLDDYLRPLINIKLGGLEVTKDTFYLRARDGGLVCFHLKIDITFVKLRTWDIRLAAVLEQHTEDI